MCVRNPYRPHISIMIQAMYILYTHRQDAPDARRELVLQARLLFQSFVRTLVWLRCVVSAVSLAFIFQKGSMPFPLSFCIHMTRTYLHQHTLDPLPLLLLGV